LSGTIYDSAAPRPTVVADLRAVWRSRGLLGVLVARDLAVRYKRSVLGVWWTLLNPLLETIVLWIVFSHIFRFATPGVPYSVFVLSGILVLTSFQQTVIGAAGAMLLQSELLRKVRVAPALFSLSTAMANLITFAFTLLPLAVVMAIAGVAPNPALPLIVPVVLALVGTAFGFGLALAPIVARFPDTLNLLRIALTLLGYLAPIFYPIAIVPEKYRIIVELNPLYHFVTLFRVLLFGDGLGSGWSWLAIAVSTTVCVAVGRSVHTALRRGAFAAL